jgi:hypothetical protein
MIVDGRIMGCMSVIEGEFGAIAVLDIVALCVGLSVGITMEVLVDESPWTTVVVGMNWAFSIIEAASVGGFVDRGSSVNGVDTQTPPGEQFSSGLGASTDPKRKKRLGLNEGPTSGEALTRVRDLAVTSVILYYK